MKHEHWPEVGTKMYFVCEHRYYIQDRAGPVMAYCVCAGEVQGFFTGGYTEMRLVGPNPDGYRTPYYYKLSAIGQTIFYTAK